MRFRWVTLLAAALAALALLGAACGGDDDDDTGADGGAATATVDSGDGGDDGGDETPEATADDEGDDGDSTGAVDACSLITKDEAEAALGESVSEGTSLDVAPVFSCTYDTETFNSLSIAVVVFGNADQAEAVYDLAIENNDYPEIDGIGDRAYFALGFGVTGQKDKYEVTIDILGPDDDQPLEEDLAQKALDRLP